MVFRWGLKLSIGIYKITNIINGKVYIGKSLNIEKRFKQHKTDLNHNRNHNNHFQNAWNKYGENSFIFEIIHECNEQYIDDLEIYYIYHYDSYNSNYGYNYTLGGEGGKLTEEYKNKMREKCKFKNASLNEHEVRKIKLLLYCLMDRQEIADIFNIDVSTVKSIAEVRNYYYVAEELNDSIKGLKRKLLDDRNDKVFELYDKGYRIVDIVEEMKLSKSCVEHIIYDRDKHVNKKYEYENKYNEIYNKVVSMHNEGIINYHIAKKLNISPSTVTRYLNKYYQQVDTEITQEIKKP